MEALTRKIGPLPVWAYAAIIGGALLAWRLSRGGGRQDGSVQLIPTGAPAIDPSAGFLNELSDRLERIEQGIGNTPVTPPPPASEPTGSGWDRWRSYLRPGETILRRTTQTVQGWATPTANLPRTVVSPTPFPISATGYTRPSLLDGGIASRTISGSGWSSSS